MRIDKYLKVSRVIKRRTVANEACDGGRVSVNGRPAKAGTDVKPGDIVEVAFAGGKTKFEILSVAEGRRERNVQNYNRITGGTHEKIYKNNRSYTFLCFCGRTAFFL